MIDVRTAGMIMSDLLDTCIIPAPFDTVAKISFLATVPDLTGLVNSTLRAPDEKWINAVDVCVNSYANSMKEHIRASSEKYGVSVTEDDSNTYSRECIRILTSFLDKARYWAKSFGTRNNAAS